MRQFDLFILSSLNEGISNTVLEAMATGIPVIATNVGGNPELVDDGETGFLVPASDPRTLALVIERYLHDPEMIKRHGRNGREKAEQQYSLHAMVDRYLATYDDLIGSVVQDR